MLPQPEEAGVNESLIWGDYYLEALIKIGEWNNEKGCDS